MLSWVSPFKVNEESVVLIKQYNSMYERLKKKMLNEPEVTSMSKLAGGSSLNILSCSFFHDNSTDLERIESNNTFVIESCRIQ